MFYFISGRTHNKLYHLGQYTFSKEHRVVNVQIRTSSFVKWYKGLWSPKVVTPPYKHVTQIGDPVLRNVTSKVPVEQIKSHEIQSIIKTMKNVMRKYDSFGLSAPQIGVSLRIFAMEFNAKSKDEFSAEVCKRRDMDVIPFTIFINPEMKILNYDKIVLLEACESFRGYSAEVPRYKEVSVSGYNNKGEPITMKAKGWTARIIQHEMDHLNGRLYTDLMDKNTLTCGCWQLVNSRAGRIEIRFTP